ncbi:MAG: glycosyltransferase family 4 protein, partial [Dehalococcoidia bacterium]
VLFRSHRYYPDIGGVEHHVRNISERLAREHDVTVFTCESSGKLPREENINGVKVRRFHSFSPKDSYHISLGMLGELRRSSFDVVHGHSYHAFPMLFSQYARANRFIVNTYYHGHGHTQFRDALFRLYKPLGSGALRSADTIVALSNYERDLLLRDFKLNSGGVVVIPYGIDLAEFKDLHREQGEKKKILYVGRLEEYKGVQYIIQALPLAEAGTRLEIVGKGPYKKHLEQTVRDLKLEERVAFFQDLERKELLSKYASS